MSDVVCPICMGLGVCFDVPCGECDATGQPRDLDDSLGYCDVCLGKGANFIEECNFCFGSGLMDQESASKLLY